MYPAWQMYGYQQNGNPQQTGQPYFDRMAQLQQQYNQFQSFGQPVQPQPAATGLNGEVVDGIDVVKAKNVDLSGNVTFYPKADMTEIYTKQLQADGTSRIGVYKLVIPEKQGDAAPVQNIDMEAISGMFVQLKQDLLNEINGIKGMLPAVSDEPSKPQRGGGQK